eukprot:GHVT01073764.1.p1 GENE.GHVT01073764.1~~GHVT01073764.1.p1  ORF type:complete len:511 (-),score=52.39 GHVT01073764.1:1586-3118(-)
MFVPLRRVATASFVKAVLWRYNIISHCIRSIGVLSLFASLFSASALTFHGVPTSPNLVPSYVSTIPPHTKAPLSFAGISLRKLKRRSATFSTVYDSFQGSTASKFPAASTAGSIDCMREVIRRTSASGDHCRRKVIVLGSTGSIGQQTLSVIRSLPDHFEVLALTAGSNVELLAKQCAEFKPRVAAIAAEARVADLKAAVMHLGQDRPQVLGGCDGVAEAATVGGAEGVVVTGIVGTAGLLPTVAAIEAGKAVALANKETLIAAGPVMQELLRKHKTLLLAADSEHSAILQCLQGTPSRGDIRRLILTASGGAFRSWPKEDLRKATVQDALKHPNWSMGPKITIDSATLMNKGLEVIEAHYLFGIPYDKIDVLIHPQSIVHSLVEFVDTTILAQLGKPDMKVPLLYTLSWPARLPIPLEPLDLVKAGSLTFEEADRDKYPCLALGYAAGRMGGTMPAVLSAANEEAVRLFRCGLIHFVEIPRVIERTMDAHKNDVITQNVTLEVTNKSYF